MRIPDCVWSVVHPDEKPNGLKCGCDCDLLPDCIVIRRPDCVCVVVSSGHTQSSRSTPDCVLVLCCGCGLGNWSSATTSLITGVAYSFFWLPQQRLQTPTAGRYSTPPHTPAAPQWYGRFWRPALSGPLPPIGMIWHPVLA